MQQNDEGPVPWANSPINKQYEPLDRARGANACSVLLLVLSIAVLVLDNVRMLYSVGPRLEDQVPGVKEQPG
jgi:hypothetical protein